MDLLGTDWLTVIKTCRAHGGWICAFDELKPNQTTSDQFTCGSNDGWLNLIWLMNLGAL